MSAYLTQSLSTALSLGSALGPRPRKTLSCMLEFAPLKFIDEFTATRIARVSVHYDSATAADSGESLPTHEHTTGTTT